MAAGPLFVALAGATSDFRTTGPGVVVQAVNSGALSLVNAPAANDLFGWDNTDGTYCNITIGTGLTYDHATHTLNASGSSVSIGNAIGSGVAWEILYVDGSSNLAQDSNLIYHPFSAGGGGLFVSDGTNGIQVATGSYALIAGNPTYAVSLAGASFAANFADGTNTVTLCNGTYAIEVSTGAIRINTVAYLWPGSGSAGVLVNGGSGNLTWVQSSMAGTTSGHTSGVGAAVLNDDTFDGGVGGTAYTIGDIVAALKLIGALAP